MGQLVVSILRRKYSLQVAAKLLLSQSRMLSSFIIEEVDGTWSVSPRLLAFNFCVSLVSSLTMHPVLHDDEQPSGGISYLVRLQILLFSFCQVVGVYSQVFHLKEIRQIMNSLKFLEGIFLNIGSKRFIFDGPPLHYVICNSLVLITVGILTLLRLEKINLKYFSFLFHIPGLAFVLLMDVFCICTLMYSIQVSLSYLNGFLISLKSGDLKYHKQIHEDVERSCKAYDVLCSQADRLNTVFGIQLLIVFITCFSQMVSNLYFIVLVNYYNADMDYICLIFLWVSFPFTVTIWITQFCDSIVVKAKEFNTLLYQLIMDDRTGISQNKKLRLHILMRRQIVFTAGGFFNIDYKLFHSMMAAITTYLVILVQFGLPVSSLSNVGAEIFLNSTPITESAKKTRY